MRRRKVRARAASAVVFRRQVREVKRGSDEYRNETVGEPVFRISFLLRFRKSTGFETK
jgi:hypothetical protein